MAGQRKMKIIQPLESKSRKKRALVGEFDLAEGALANEKNILQAIMESTKTHLAYLDRQFNFIRVNSAYAKGSGYEIKELLGNNHFTLFPNQENQAIFERVRDSGNAEEYHDKPFVYPFQPQRGITYWDWTLVPIKDSSGQVMGLVLSLTDTTQRKRAEELLVLAKNELELKVKERTVELAESEEKYRKLVDSANEAILVIQDDRLKFFNPKALELYHCSKEEILACNFHEFIHPEDRELVSERYKKRISGEAISSNYEHRIITKDAQTKWVSIQAVLIQWENRPASLAILTDITSRKKAEEALTIVNERLKIFGHRLTRVQEEERKRIAYELHDDTAQYLSILKLQLDSLVQSGKIQDKEALEKLQYLVKDADRAFNDVRRYRHELRPVMLEHMGLAAALEQIAEDINLLNDIELDVEVQGREPELSEDIKLGFFRIAQEALNNIRKHAKTKQAKVSLQFEKKLVSMMVTDYGRGFDTLSVGIRSSSQGNLGLMSMQERADLIGANLRISSKPGKGTTVFVDLSL